MIIKLPERILNFTANDPDRQAGYLSALEYYEASKKGTATSIMHKDMHDHILSEIAFQSGLAPEAVLSHFNRTNVKEILCEVVGSIIDVIEPYVLKQDYGWLVETRNVAWGDSVKFSLKPRHMFVSSKVGHSKRMFDIQRDFIGEKTVVPEWHGITVGIDLYDILTGRYTLGEYLVAAMQAMEMELRYEILDLFTTAMNNVSTPFMLTNWTQDTAVELAQRVSAYSGGAPVSFVGTKLALSKILPATTASTPYNLTEQRVALGYQRDFFGTPCLELEQVADYRDYNNFGLKLPNDRIYVIPMSGDKLVKVVTEGNTISNNSGDFGHANLLVTGTMRRSWGAALITNSFAGTIKLT